MNPGNRVFQAQKDRCTRESTETVWQCAYDLHGFKADGIPALREGSRHRVSPLTRKPLAIDT